MSELGHEVVHRPTKSRRYSGLSGLSLGRRGEGRGTCIVADTSRLRCAELIVPPAAALALFTIRGDRACDWGTLGGGCGGLRLGRRHSHANRHEQ